MSYNEQLQNIDLELQAILETVNELPEAGSDIVLQEKSVTPTKSKQSVVADAGYTGLSKVSVEEIPDEYIIPSGTKSITTNGTHDVTENASVSVAVPIPDGYIQPSGTKSITENGTHSVREFEDVNVNVPIPDGYIVPSGTMNINSNGSYDVTEKASVVVAVDAPTPVLQNKTVTPTTSKQTINADSGYDGLDTVTVNAMPTATQATPTILVSSSGLITASSTQSAGYVASGTKSATKQLTAQAAQTITPSTSDKTIASGLYLTGTQTIKGDANLIAANIKKGVSIFGIAGSHEGSTAASDSFSAIPTKYTVKRLSSDVTYGGKTCAQIQFTSTPEITLPSGATQATTAFYWEHSSLGINSMVKAIVAPSSGYGGAKLSDFVFYVDDSSGYVTYGMGLSFGGSIDVNTEYQTSSGWCELAVYVDGRELSMRNYTSRSGSNIVVGDGSSSGGGGVETCTVMVSIGSFAEVYYTTVNANGEVTFGNCYEGKNVPITVVKNSVLMTINSEGTSISGNFVPLWDFMYDSQIYQICGDCTIVFDED